MNQQPRPGRQHRPLRRRGLCFPPLRRLGFPPLRRLGSYFRLHRHWGWSFRLLRRPSRRRLQRRQLRIECRDERMPPVAIVVPAAPPAAVVVPPAPPAVLPAPPPVAVVVPAAPPVPAVVPAAPPVPAVAPPAPPVLADAPPVAAVVPPVPLSCWVGELELLHPNVPSANIAAQAKHTR